MGCTVAERRRIRRAVSTADDHRAVVGTAVLAPDTGDPHTRQWRGEIVVASEIVPAPVLAAIADAGVGIVDVSRREVPTQRIVTVA